MMKLYTRMMDEDWLWILWHGLSFLPPLFFWGYTLVSHDDCTTAILVLSVAYFLPTFFGFEFDGPFFQNERVVS